MKLLLDVGNTSVKWAVHEGAAMGLAGSFRHRGEDFNALAQSAWGELKTPAKIVVSNVAGSEMGGMLAEWVNNHLGVAPVFAHVTDRAFGVTNAYARPADLGVDRWAALIGAHASATGALCIVDCGTAITLDFLAENGLHQGGMILPGIEMLQRVLLKNTADIHLSGEAGFNAPFAKGTADAVHGGAVYTVAAVIDRVVADMETAAGTCPGVIVTGGDAGRIQPLLSCSTRHDEDLVLKGLAILGGES